MHRFIPIQIAFPHSKIKTPRQVTCPAKLDFHSTFSTDKPGSNQYNGSGYHSPTHSRNGCNFFSQSPNQMISLILLFGFLCRSYSQIQVTEKYSTAMCYFWTWIGLNLVQRLKMRLHQLKRKINRTKFALMPPIRRPICHIFYLFSINQNCWIKYAREACENI